MSRFPRRLFLQTATSILGAGSLSPLFGNAPQASPGFVETPGFKPHSLILTWFRDPTTTMVIQWVGTDAEGRDRPIWFAPADGMAWEQRVSTHHRFPMTDLWIHRTELVGLKPDSQYRFRIGLDSEEYKFQTMPSKATDSFRFISGGDSGIDIHAQQTNKLAAAQNPMFVFLGGDLAYENGKDPAVFLQFIKNYSDQLRDEQQRIIPLIACLGNHETQKGYHQPRDSAPFFFAFFDGLFNNGGHAVLDFGNYLSMVMLDSGHTTPIAGEQTDWLEQTLKQREERPSLFVAYHVPSYPSVRPYDLTDPDKSVGFDSRKYWVPLFERYNVDAVLEHHDHTFKRTIPLINSVYDKNGLVYLGDGSWGKIRKPKTTSERPYLAKATENYHLSLHSLEGEQRFHVALSDTGKIVDLYTTRKRARI